MATSSLEVRRLNGVGTLYLNRPNVRNALNYELRAQLLSALRLLDDDDTIAAVIVTGADPAFCAGLDLTELASGEHRLQSALAKGTGRSPLDDCRKTLIGAINGPAVTGGLELALSCDFLVASDRASFADTHARIGIQPAWGMTVRLPEAIGLRRAKEMSATGNYIDAQTAYEWGLVNHVVPHAELLSFAQRLAEDVGSSDDIAVEQILSTYAEITTARQSIAWSVEQANAADWVRKGNGAADSIARRREALQSRGRSQANGPAS